MLLNITENGIHLVIEVTEQKQVRLLHCGPLPLEERTLGDEEDRRWFRLVELHCAGGNAMANHGSKHVGGDPGRRLTFQGWSDSRNCTGRKIEVRQAYEGLVVTSHLQFVADLPVLRCWTEVRNDSPSAHVLEYVSSFCLTGIAKEGSFPAADKLRIHIPHHTWHGEGQWRTCSLDDLALRPVQGYSKSYSIKRCSIENSGTWSSGGYLPMGAVQNTQVNTTLLWQIEHNGSWQWELSSLADHFYVQLSGPTFQENHWAKNLKPGETFTSVPAAVACVKGDFAAAVQTLTRYRRLTRRPAAGSAQLPVVFNDYMNCLFGDPTSEKLHPLIDAAADVGCEVFCIDAGWYCDAPGADAWWTQVGQWRASTTRFPDTLKRLLDRIRSRGMIPGLWLEPEVMGVDCPLATQWPDECFFMRHGRRVIDHGRYQLDLRHPRVIEHLNDAVRYMVQELGVGYIKIDYNINAGVGTELSADSLGDGLLQCNRAHLDWLDDVIRRYPNLILENCASGGMRMDWALLSRHSIQSTSDQTDYRKSCVIASSIATAVLPEQCGNWVYPLADADREAVAFNVINGLVGRTYLSGRPDRLSEEGRTLIRAGIALHKQLRHKLANALPAWPTGVPSFADDWVAYALDLGGERYLAVWHRGGGPSTCTVPLGDGQRFERVELVYPSFATTGWSFDVRQQALTVTLENPPQGRLFRLSAI